MEAVQTSETLVNSYQSTRRYNTEDGHLQHVQSSLLRKIAEPPDSYSPFVCLLGPQFLTTLIPCHKTTRLTNSYHNRSTKYRVRDEAPNLVRSV
jgi:hypothetical protein